MEVHGQLSLGHFGLKIPFKSNYKVFGKICPSVSNSILCNGLSFWIEHSIVADPQNLKYPTTATETYVI